MKLHTISDKSVPSFLRKAQRNKLHFDTNLYHQKKATNEQKNNLKFVDNCNYQQSLE